MSVINLACTARSRSTDKGNKLKATIIEEEMHILTFLDVFWESGWFQIYYILIRILTRQL